MSQVQPNVDLAALARPSAPLEPPKRSKLRIVVPLALLLGFAAVLASTMTDLFRPVHDVSVVRPTQPSAEMAAGMGANTVAVQASGWIEPDPFLLQVTALADGVVEEVLVAESDRVENGQIVARLVDADARIARDRAAADVALQEAEWAQATARRNIAKERLDEALAVTEARDMARALQKGAQAAATLQAAAVREGEARVRLALDELEVQRELEAQGTNGVRQVELAEGAVEEARGRLAALQAQAELAEAKVIESGARQTRAEREFELRLEDRLELDLSEAQVQQAEAKLGKARAMLEEAELRVARMEVRAPSAGIVLERNAVPGMVLSANGSQNPICSLYDPQSLRVRVDVPQPEVARIFVGQRAEIESESRRRKPYQGEVLRVVQQANLSKVTLEVHVRILDPDRWVRPEMLAQVRFFGSEHGESDAAANSSDAPDTTVLIPSRLVEASTAWVVGPGSTAERRTLQLGAEHGELVEVRGGLNLTDKLVDEGRANLTEGDRLRIRGEAQ